jgi:hypothetical protein
MFLHKLNSSGFSDAYVSWFRNYLKSSQFRVRFPGTLSRSFQVTSYVPQGSFLAPFLVNIFINDLCSRINYCKILISANDLKIFRVINSPHDCLLLESVINSVSDWCTANSMRILPKRMLCNTTGKYVFWVTSISFVMLPLHASADLRT